MTRYEKRDHLQNIQSLVTRTVVRI